MLLLIFPQVDKLVVSNRTLVKIFLKSDPNKVSNTAFSKVQYATILLLIPVPTMDGFIAQLVEQCTGNPKVLDSNAVQS